MIEVRRSPIAGQGVFALQRIPKGTRIIEYTGERVSADEANRRYSAPDAHRHVLLFSLEDGTQIDAAVGGNEARFINHSCAPNCEAVEEDGHIYIDAIKTIPKGSELTYSYYLDVADDDEEREKYPCHCGARTCRGTLIAL